MVHLSKMMLVVCIAIHKLLHFRYVLTTEIVEKFNSEFAFLRASLHTALLSISIRKQGKFKL